MAARSRLPVVAAAFGAGIEATLDAARPIWTIALSRRMLTGSIEALRSRLLGDPPGSRALSASERARILVELERLAIPRVVFEEMSLLDAFLQQFAGLWERSRLADWNIARYETAVRDLAERFVTGDIAAAHLETAIVVPQFDAGQRRAQRADEMRALFPYLEQVTRDDDVVRENHFALHLFVARIDHEIWINETASPHGWRCRCRGRRIPFTQAEEDGLRGDFPLGTGKLEAFRALGGSDAGFPRDRFVIA